jgi:hypothetical protein
MIKMVMTMMMMKEREWIYDRSGWYDVHRLTAIRSLRCCSDECLTMQCCVQSACVQSACVPLHCRVCIHVLNLSQFKYYLVDILTCIYAASGVK